MKTLAYSFKTITDLTQYVDSCFRGNTDLIKIACINKNYADGHQIVINTSINTDETRIFLNTWGVRYTKIIDTGVKQSMG